MRSNSLESGELVNLSSSAATRWSANARLLSTRCAMGVRERQLAERLCRQQIKWLEAVSVDWRDGEAIIGAAPVAEREPLAASAITSAFQAVHVLSLVHANQYGAGRRLTRADNRRAARRIPTGAARRSGRSDRRAALRVTAPPDRSR